MKIVGVKKGKKVEPFCALHIELKSETLHTVAGFHDVEKWSTDAQRSSDSYVARHEAYHDRFLSETPFGIIQILFKGAYKTTTRSDLQPIIKTWFDHLLDFSRKVHEISATYCSIKSFPLEAQSRVIDLHDESYRDFYCELADLVDTVFYSSYLQFSVGKSLAELCLSPFLYEQIIALDTLGEVKLQDEYCPDERFVIFKEFFDKKRLGKLVKHLEYFLSGPTNRKQLRGGFDPQDEKAWLNLPAETAFQVDSQVDAEIRKWMHNEGDKRLRSLPQSEWRDANQCLCEWFNRHLKSNLEILAPTTDSMESLADDAIGRAMRTGNYSMFHRIPRDPKEIPMEEDSAQSASELLKLCGSRTVITSTNCVERLSELEWIFMAMDSRKEETIAARIPNSLLERILRLRNLIALTGAPTYKFEAIIVGCNCGGFPEIYNKLLSMHRVSLNKGGPLVDPYLLTWYMSGDIFDWMTILSEYGRLQYMPIMSRGKRSDVCEAVIDNPHEISGYEEMEQISKNFFARTSLGHLEKLNIDKCQGLQGFVIRAPKLNGIFLRWFPTEIASLLGPGLSQFDLDIVPEADRDNIALRAIGTLTPISTLWKES